MRFLLAFAHAIDAVSEWLGRLATVAVLLAVGSGFYNVVARYVGRYIGVQLSSNTLLELQWYLYSITFFLGFAFILKHGDNVRVDILYTRWGARRQAAVDLIGTLLIIIPFCLLALAVAYRPVMTSWAMWEMSPDPGGLPRGPIKAMLLMSFFFLLLQAVAQAIKYGAAMLGERQVVEELQGETADRQMPE